MPKIRSKISIAIGLILLVSTFVFSADANAENTYNLEVISITVTKHSQCSYKWQAVVRNSGANALAAGDRISATAYQGKDGADWEPASGSSISSLASGAEVSAGNVTFIRRARKNQLKVVLFYKGASIAESVYNLPAEPDFSFEIANCELTPTGYTAVVRNTSSEYASDFTVQGYAASAANPDSWVGAGGMSVDCLAPQATYQKTGLRPAGYEIIKVDIYRGGVLVTEKVFNFSPPPAEGSDGQTGGQVLGKTAPQSKTSTTATKIDPNTLKKSKRIYP